MRQKTLLGPGGSKCCPALSIPCRWADSQVVCESIISDNFQFLFIDISVSFGDITNIVLLIRSG